MRRLLHVAMTRARKGLVLAWPEGGQRGPNPRPSPFYEEARRAVGVEEEVFEEELFGPAEGLHSTFRIMRDELLDTVARMGGRLGEMRLDTYLDIAQAVSRYLELIKVAALIERAKDGETLDAALREINEILLQWPRRSSARSSSSPRSTAGCATPSATRPSAPGRAERRASRRSTRSSRAAAAA